MRKLCRGLTISLCAASLMAGTLTFADADARSVSYDLNIPSEDLTAALQSFAIASHHKLLFKAELTAGKTSRAVKGHFTAQEAVEALLSGTGLTFEITGSSVVLIKDRSDSKTTDLREEASGAPSVAYSPSISGEPIRLAQANPTVPSNGSADLNSSKGSNAQDSKESNKEGLSEIIVTGTHIRGVAPVGSSLKIYSRDDIDRSGAATLEQFARQIPENFSDVDPVSNGNSNANYAAFTGASANTYAGSAFDLHGLGPTSTLTLLNGHRLAPAGSGGQFVDASLIPLSAIDHIEILADGASAIYGSDAVAGVVNIVTKQNFDGAETGLRYGLATRGGADEITASQLVGTSWSTGSILFDYEHDGQNGLDASDRTYIPSQGGPDSLIPTNVRNSAILVGSQNFDTGTTVFGDASFSRRQFSQQSTTNSTFFVDTGRFDGSAAQSSGTVTVDQTLARDWHVSVTGNYSHLQQKQEEFGILTVGGDSSTTVISQDATSNIGGAGVALTGTLASLPAGAAKIAVGADFRSETFLPQNSVATIDGTTTSGGQKLRRNVRSVYAETFLPLIGQSNASPWTQRLELSAAARYDNYSDFGSTTNPKFGLLWEPVTGVNFRGSFGKSFRAPLLTELGTPNSFETFPIGANDTLIVGGGNPNLKPERSRTFTGGFDLTPELMNGFSLAATYFNTVFENRIATPPVSNIFTIFSTPAIAPFIQENPPLSVVEAAFRSPGFQGDFVIDPVTGLPLGPAGVTAIYNGSFTNIAKSTQSGVDLALGYLLKLGIGTIQWSATVDRFLQNQYQASNAVPGLSLINTFGEPPKWKGRAGVAWSFDKMFASINVNYINSYTNTLTVPSETISSWTTGDLYVGYKTGNTASASYLRGVTVALSVQNITDEKPPFVQFPASLLPAGVNAIPFDPTNASPLGRLVSIRLTKDF